MRQGNSLSLKRGRKNLKRRRIREHIARVGRRLYESEKINVICVECNKTHNIRYMTLNKSGLGIGPCKACIAITLKENPNEDSSKKA